MTVLTKAHTLYLLLEALSFAELGYGDEKQTDRASVHKHTPNLTCSTSNTQCQQSSPTTALPHLCECVCARMRT